MFPYDAELIAAAEATPKTIADVVAIMQAIDALCVDGDGLKWFNLLYMQVTKAVEARINTNGFLNPAWMAALDVEFAGYYFRAIQSRLSAWPCAMKRCWLWLRARCELARQDGEGGLHLIGIAIGPSLCASSSPWPA